MTLKELLHKQKGGRSKANKTVSYTWPTKREGGWVNTVECLCGRLEPVR